MRIVILSISVAILSLISCNTTSTSSDDKLYYKSFEFTNKGDTFNIVDGNGMKQGLWLMPISKDTVIYLNDTAYSVTNMTSGEMIRHLKKDGSKGFMALPDSFAVKSN